LTQNVYMIITCQEESSTISDIIESSGFENSEIKTRTALIMELPQGYYLQDIMLYGNPYRKIVAVLKKLTATVQINAEDVEGVGRDMATIVWTARHEGLVWCGDKWKDAGELAKPGILY
jgi:hypothetical protein